MKSVKCKSGITGWQGRLNEVYESVEEWEHICRIYNHHLRLGYKSPQTAWKANPMLQGSVNPSDFRKVKVKPVVELYNIVWDTDGVSPKRLNLPKSVKYKVGARFNPEMEGADKLSDEFGYCVESFSFKWVA